MARISQASKATKICLGCRAEKDLQEFNFREKKTGERQRWCRECTRLQLKRHYYNNRDYYIRKSRRRIRELKRRQRVLMLTYLSQHPCVDCGENDPVCLEFDHVRGQKVEPVSGMLGRYEWSTIEREIAKCVVRCANCHRRRTAVQRGYYKLLLVTASVRP